MSTVGQLEASIEHLPPGDFLDLIEWMTDRHLQLLAGEGFESAELEAAMLQGLEGPRHEMDAGFFNSIRAGWRHGSRSMSCVYSRA